MQFIATNNTAPTHTHTHTQLMTATATATATSCRLSDELTGISVSHFSQLPNWPGLDSLLLGLPAAFFFFA